MSDHPRPARAIVWLLERMSSTHAAHAAIGDVLEELQERTSAGRQPRWPALWLTLQVLGAAGAAARVAAPRLLRSLADTLRDAARALRHSPSHALFILVVLAVAIAAATVTFSVVDAVVLRPLPFDRSDQLVQIAGRNPRGPFPLRTALFWPIHDSVPAFESVGAFMRSLDKTPVTVDGTTEPLTVMRSTAELFQVLRLVPVVGRVWSSDEEARGDRQMAVISFRFWQRRFGGDPSVLGRLLTVDKDSYQIVGVLQASADAAQTIGWSHEVWLPFVPDRVVTDRSNTFVFALARLREGATPALAEAQMTSALDVTGMSFSRGSVWSSSPALDPLPAVIDEVAARRLFGTRDPLGLQFLSDFPDDAIFFKVRKAVFTVVGVVPFVYSKGPEGQAQPSMYLPIVERPSRIFAALFARTAGPADALVPAVEQALAPVAPQGAQSYVHAVDEAFARLTATRRFTAALMSLFALLAMLIGAAGIYGVMASIVAQRTREIGVRIALGASVADIRRGVLREVGRHLALGLAGGLPIAWWISRGFGTLFFQVRPTDLSIYLTVAILLAVVALVAALVPARRASRVDPIVSLRAS